MKSLFKNQKINIFFILCMLFSVNTAWSQQIKSTSHGDKIPSVKKEQLFFEVLNFNLDEIKRIEIARFYTLKNSELDGNLKIKQVHINDEFNEELSELLISTGHKNVVGSFLSSRTYIKFKSDVYNHYEKIVGNKRENIPTRFTTNSNSIKH